MGSKSTVAIGGGSGAVITSAHAGCERFRGTDPLITGQTRRALAVSLGVPKSSASSIPDSRWVRALTFEALVHDEKFASRIAEQALAGANLPRPDSVSVLNANGETAQTIEQLKKAVSLAIKGTATLVYAAAVPPPGFSEDQATLVLPDFLVVAADPAKAGDAVLIVGDAKDYERIRSRIDDSRMLKGFLQVAFGIASFEAWQHLPASITVSQFGALAVPRNAFLQPTVVTENLTDHKQEVVLRLDKRISDAENIKWSDDAEEFVTHLRATYNPDSCRTCPLFEFCRSQLRHSPNPLDVLQEIGVQKAARKRAASLISEGLLDPKLPASVAHQILATTSGKAIKTGKLRTDPVSLPGSVNVVIAKSDSAALGIYGLSLQVVDELGRKPWKTKVFSTPQSDQTRREVLHELGIAISGALQGDISSVGDTQQIALIVPDQATADILASIADTVAGNEISRLRWQRDLEMGRPALTFDGNPAVVPPPLTAEQRLATSFLIEEDRARAFQGRRPTVNLVSILSELFTPGGTTSAIGRLDYLTEWAATLKGTTVDFRKVETDIEKRENTPGARLSVLKSNDIHKANTAGKISKSDMATYELLVEEELAFKRDVFDHAVEVLESFEVSNIRESILQLERDAQRIWRRRFEFRAFDLVRFGLTPRNWRNALVEVVEKDAMSVLQLYALANPVWADSQAKSAGTRELAIARVTALSPVRVSIDSRRFGVGDEIVLIHRNGEPYLEEHGVTSKCLVTFIQVRGLPKVVLESKVLADASFELDRELPLSVGDELVIADAQWFIESKRNDEVKIVRAKVDGKSAPEESCTESSYELDPEQHRWCCRPHEAREAETSDWFASQRAEGKMNPQIWPPVVDAEAFDQESPADPSADSVEVTGTVVPIELNAEEMD